MTQDLQDAQQVQENWYSFPYHYVTALPPRFGVARVYDWHLNYASAVTFLLDQIAAEEQRGFFVTPVSKEDLREIASLRILLESHALRQSIANGDTEWEGDLVAAHHKLHRMEVQMQAGDETGKETWKRYDWEFYQALIRACNSQNLLALHSTIYDKYLRYQMLVYTFRGEAAAAEHRGMLDAALAREDSEPEKADEDGEIARKGETPPMQRRKLLRNMVRMREVASVWSHELADRGRRHLHR